MTREGRITIDQILEGGCLCGAVRYRVAPCDADSGYCHCRLCQRSAGAPVMAWVSVPRECLTILRGTPRTYRSSSHAGRNFCPDCGTQLFFSDDSATTIDITTATLDAPAHAPPRYHIWRESRIPWFEAHDDLPRFNDRGIDP